jgi:aldose 1-epimerase
VIVARQQTILSWDLPKLPSCRLPTILDDVVDKVKGGTENGFDHNFVINSTARGTLSLAAQLYDPSSGRHMEVYTTEPGVQVGDAIALEIYYLLSFNSRTCVCVFFFFQVYTYNYGSKQPSDHPFVQHNSICLETQNFPNSINTPNFPNSVLRPGEQYHHLTIHKFRLA